MDRLAKSKAQVTTAVLDALSKEKAKRVLLEQTLSDTLPSSPLEYGHSFSRNWEEPRTRKNNSPGKSVYEDEKYSGSSSARTVSSDQDPIVDEYDQPYDELVPITAVDKLKA